MIEVRYSLNEAVDILGSRQEIESFRQKVLEFLKTDLEKIYIEIDVSINPEPWNFVAKNL